MPKPNLNKMTKTELIELARKRKVAIKNTMLKAEILGLLEKAEKISAKAKKPVKAKTASRTGRKTAVKTVASAAKKSPAAKKVKPSKTANSTTTAKTKKAEAGKTPTPATKNAAQKKPVEAVKGKARFSPWSASAAKEKAVPAAEAALIASEKTAPDFSSGGLPHRKIELEDKAQEAKFIVGGPNIHETWLGETSKELPANYGDHSLVLLARDPYWVYLFWELDQKKIDHGLSTLACSMEEARCVLRMHPLSEEAGSPFDVDVDFRTGRHYLQLSPPGASFFAEIGMTDAKGRFFCLARSNSMTLPRDKPSDILDERWMTTDEEFEQIYTLSGGREGNGELSGSESIDKREHGVRKLSMDFPTSPVSSFGSASLGKSREKGFSFWLDAELIVYGGADLGSRIELEGKPLELRPDGTFTVRFALPDGQLNIPVRFVSPDGDSTHNANVEVTRKTRIEKEAPDWEPIY